MAEGHGHIGGMAHHHHGTATAFHWHHRATSGIWAHKGVVHLVITEALGVKRSLMADPATHFVELSPAQIAAVDTQLIIQPGTATYD